MSGGRPRTDPAKVARALELVAEGRPVAEAAAEAGVSLSVLKRALRARPAPPPPALTDGETVLLDGSNQLIDELVADLQGLPLPALVLVGELVAALAGRAPSAALLEATTDAIVAAAERRPP